jgi:hypothetical protein
MTSFTSAMTIAGIMLTASRPPGLPEAHVAFQHQHGMAATSGRDSMATRMKLTRTMNKTAGMANTSAGIPHASPSHEASCIGGFKPCQHHDRSHRAYRKTRHGSQLLVYRSVSEVHSSVSASLIVVLELHSQAAYEGDPVRVVTHEARSVINPWVHLRKKQGSSG